MLGGGTTRRRVVGRSSSNQDPGTRQSHQLGKHQKASTNFDGGLELGAPVGLDVQNLFIAGKYQIQGVFLHWASPKKLKYGEPGLGESTLT